MSVTIMAAVFAANMPELKTDDGKTVPDSTAKFVLLALADHASEDGENAYIGVKRICQKTNLSTSTVCNALNALRTNGIIELVGKSKADTNNYTINLSRLQSLKFQQPKSDDSSHRNPTILAAEIKPSINHQNNQKPADAGKPDMLDGELSKLPALSIRKAVTQYFSINVNWETKTSRQFLEWANGEGITAEQIETAAQVWREDKQFNWQHPTLKGIFEKWNLLMQAAPKPQETKPEGKGFYA